MTTSPINSELLLSRLHTLGAVGRDAQGMLSRLACSDADREGRDLMSGWAREAGLDVLCDAIGNLFFVLRADGNDEPPVLIGSHIDTVINAGIYDGCYGVLSGLAVLEALKTKKQALKRSVAVVAFTNEEGVRFTPSLYGARVFTGVMSLEDAYAKTDGDGLSVGSELKRIGYIGSDSFPMPSAYIELHIEQGPVLEAEGKEVGVVTGVNGAFSIRVTIDGLANHAGTTPMHLRYDAGQMAARFMRFVDELARAHAPDLVATVGTIAFEPNAINVIPSRARLTVDCRSPKAELLSMARAAMQAEVDAISAMTGFSARLDLLGTSEPVHFDPQLIDLVEASAASAGRSALRLPSGAGHDAQMMAAVCPTTMIFIPSEGGISHNPREFSTPEDIASGAEVLFEVVAELATR